MAKSVNTREKKIPPTQQGRVLELLWVNLGGPKPVAELLGKSNSICNAWKRITAKVPMKNVMEVAEKLDVSPLLLNYKEVSRVQNSKLSWKEVIEKSGMFDAKDLKYIYEGLP